MLEIERASDEQNPASNYRTTCWICLEDTHCICAELKMLENRTFLYF
jgi:hypothetical protein